MILQCFSTLSPRPIGFFQVKVKSRSSFFPVIYCSVTMRSCRDLYFWVRMVIYNPGKIVYLQWIRWHWITTLKCHKQNKLKLPLLNSFGSPQSSPEHLQTFSAMFRTLQKIVRNLFEVTDTFWFSEFPVMTRWKSHTFDSKSTLRYKKVGTLSQFPLPPPSQAFPNYAL